MDLQTNSFDNLNDFNTFEQNSEIMNEKAYSLQMKSGLKDWKFRSLLLEIGGFCVLIEESLTYLNNEEFYFFVWGTGKLSLKTAPSVIPTE
ncbi:MAG: hypothetical protein AABX29_06135 [Nanoarchaeota archaeon]